MFYNFLYKWYTVQCAFKVRINYFQKVHNNHIRKNTVLFSLQPKELDYTGQPDVDEYLVLDYNISGRDICGSENIVAELRFSRSLLGFFLTVCLPTIVAILIGHLTNYFGDDKFDAAIGVNLTLLLVITTM